VRIRDVGPRDGLQSERPVPPSQRAALALKLSEAGLLDVEVASFVSPTAVPAMADAAHVVAALTVADAAARWWALVPNERGARAARAAGITAITVTISASEGYSQKNTRMSIDAALAQLDALWATLEGEASVDVVVSCAFGAPFDDVRTVSDVAHLVDRVRAVGPLEITLADTTGAATPRRIRDVLEAVGVEVGLHLHDTRGTALANALTAYELGVRRFDCSIGGLGGSPFAPGAGGNLATEDFVLVLEDMGIHTGVDQRVLRDACALAADLVGHTVPSRVAAAGPLPNFDSSDVRS
jgi:hydroxymethylglutaryl-CoA lyase